jgi:hypothetical protein
MMFKPATANHFFICFLLRGAILMPNEIQTFSLFDFKQLEIDSRCLWCCGRSRSTLSSLSNRNLWSEKKLAIVSRFT